MIIALVDAHPERLRGGVPRASARYLANQPGDGDAQPAHGLPRRRRAAGPGPEGSDHEARAVRAGPRGDGDHVSELAGPDLGVHGGRRRRPPAGLVLWHRAMSIAGGTSEIKRNQIGERILGLPRDPLIK